MVKVTIFIKKAWIFVKMGIKFHVVMGVSPWKKQLDNGWYA